MDRIVLPHLSSGMTNQEAILAVDQIGVGVTFGRDAVCRVAFAKQGIALLDPTKPVSVSK